MISNNKLIIRSVYKITKCFMEPAKDPKTNRYPECVREVDSFGNLILTEDDRRSNKIFIKTSDVIDIYDGKEFDLDDPFDKAQWDAIKYSKKIAVNRNDKDELGNFIIDGNAKKYGSAEFYVEKPGLEAQIKNTRRREVTRANNFIYGDSSDGLYQKVRLLGSPMAGSNLNDVEDYLLTVAEKDPQKIIDLYTGGDSHLRLFLLDAMDKQVIYKKDGVYYYSNIILGISDNAVLIWFKNPANKTAFSMIKAEVYPELTLKKDPLEIEDEIEETTKEAPIKKTSSKK